MTAPSNASLIEPSKGPDQLPVEDKGLTWNNLEIREELLNASIKNKKVPLNLSQV